VHFLLKTAVFSDLLGHLFIMRFLFIHQNLPGQFRHLLQHFASNPEHHVVAIGEQRWIETNRTSIAQGVRVLGYATPPAPNAQTHAYLRTTTSAVLRGQVVAKTLMDLKKSGFIPDVIYAHPGWGESLFVKDVYPQSKLVSFCEFFYHAHGQDTDFDPEYPSSFAHEMQLRIRNSQHLLSLDAMDLGISPTQWQKSCFPAAYQPQLEVVHDGINTDHVQPNANVSVTLKHANVTLTRQDEVITFVSRNLEPYRGFHSFMRALPQLLRERPQARVIIVGDDSVSYGKPSTHGTYRKQMLTELNGQLDLSRIHFLGRIPYAQYLQILQLSTAHVYLTYPFVLSWSMLEAMSAGCAIIGSRTAPVTEVIEAGENGLLVDFFLSEEIVEAIHQVCDHPDQMASMRLAARQTVIDRFDLKRICLPRQLKLLQPFGIDDAINTVIRDTNIDLQQHILCTRVLQ
jgi:glycosyltransferase involved in cell wall biosynthesis